MSSQVNSIAEMQNMAIKSLVNEGVHREKLYYGGVISKQNPHTETLQKPNSNFTSNTHPY